MNVMKPDDRRPVFLVEVAANSVLNHRLELIKSLRFGEHGVTQSLGLKATFRGLFNEEDDFLVQAATSLRDSCSILPAILPVTASTPVRV